MVLKDLLEHVPDPVAVVGEAHRVLRPGGRAFASSPDAQRWVWDDYTHRRPFTRKAFRQAVRGPGLRRRAAGLRVGDAGDRDRLRVDAAQAPAARCCGAGVATVRAPERLGAGAAMSTRRRPRVVIVRGHQTNAWHLRPWRHLADDFEVVVLHTRRNWFDTASLDLETKPVWALRDLLPPGAAGHALSRIPGDRYLRPRRAFRGADIVHSQDLGFWYSMQAAKHKAELGYRLVLTAWETIPFLDAYRNARTRALPAPCARRRPTCSWPPPSAHGWRC